MTKFEKILIVEDHESSKISIEKALKDLGLSEPKYVYYCDDALMRIDKELKTAMPFDLMITDLSFLEDHRPQHLKSGEELVEAAKIAQPTLKIIVFSSEDKPAIAQRLFTKYGINGFVTKGRSDVKDLKKAICDVAAGKTYLSDELRQSVREANSHEFSELDIAIISLLADGILKKEIPQHLKKYNVKHYKLSSVEKRIALMKEILEFNKNEQLVAYCKDLGII